MKTEHELEHERDLDDPPTERIALVDGRPLRGIFAMFNMIGGVAGLSAMLLGVLAYGELKRQVAVDSHRIDLIEGSGSSQAQLALKTLVMEIDARKDADAITSRRVDDIRIDFNQRITNITGLLEKLVEQQTQLITLIKVQQQQNNSK